LISEIKDVIMGSGNFSEEVRAKMLYNYLKECHRKELRELREKKKSTSQFKWIGTKLLRRFTSRYTILQK
jgi:hypothetical protein